MSHCPHCGEPVHRDPDCAPDAPPAAPRRRKRAPGAGVVLVLRVAEIGVGASAFVLVAYLLAGMTGLLPDLQVQALRGGAAVAGTEFLVDPVRARPPPPVELELLGGDVITLRTGDHFDTPFEVRDPRPCTLTGRVQGIAGGSRDVEVYVLDENGYRDWRNGVRPRALYESGRSSSASLAVELPRRGRYHLLLSNRYSILTAKRVRVDEALLRCA